MIPKNLQDDSLNFVKIIKGEKRPIAVNWTTDSTAWLKHDNEELLKWIKNGNPYGILTGGKKNLIVIDWDDNDKPELLDSILPKTFTVKTGSGGRHYYYFCNDFLDYENSKKKIYLLQKEKNFGDIRGAGFQNLVPPSPHPSGTNYEILNDYPIKEIKRENLFFLMKEYVNEYILKLKENTEQKKLFEHKETHKDFQNLRVTDIISTAGFKNAGSGYLGHHPFHASDTGTNFSFNENVWYCYRHNFGGNAWDLLAQDMGLISCGDNIGNDKDTWKKLIKEAQKRGLITKEKKKKKDKKEKKVQSVIRKEMQGLMIDNLLNNVQSVQNVCVGCVCNEEYYNKITSYIKKIRTPYIYTIYTLYTKISDFMDMEENDIKFCYLWSVGTYVHRMFSHYPYIFLNAPKSSGKSKLIKILAWSSYEGRVSSNMSTASIFHLINDKYSTIGFDESELLSSKDRSEDITNILLGGFEKGNPVARVPKNESGVNKLKEYDIFSPKIIGNIQGLSNDALESRCVPIRLLRTRVKSKANIYPEFEDPFFVNFKLVALKWAFENWEKVKSEYDCLTEAGSLVGRSFNLFRPILALCKVLKPEWYDGLLVYAEEKVRELERVVMQDSQENLVLLGLRGIVDEFKEDSVEVMPKVLKARIEVECFEGEEQKWLTYRFIGRVLKRLGLGLKVRRSRGWFYIVSRLRVVDLCERYGVVGVGDDFSSTDGDVIINNKEEVL